MKRTTKSLRLRILYYTNVRDTYMALSSMSVEFTSVRTFVGFGKDMVGADLLRKTTWMA